MGNTQGRTVVALASLTVAGLLVLAQPNKAIAQQAAGASDQAETTKGGAENRQKAAAGQAERKETTDWAQLTKDENEKRIHQVLGQTTNVNIDEKPLAELFEELSKKHNIPILLDQKALADAVIATDTPITKSVQNVTLESALRLMLRPLQLTYSIDGGVLLITTQAEAETRLETRVYQVRELIVPWDKPDSQDANNLDFDSLTDLIQSTVAPDTWDTVGGPASIVSFNHMLIISHTPEVHHQLDGLLSALRKAQAAQRKKLGGPAIDLFASEWSQRIQNALRFPIEWAFSETPLNVVIDFIAKSNDVGIQLDEKALADAVVATNTPINLTVRDIPMASGLRHLLRPLQLTYVIRDEVLLITTQAEAETKLQIRLYPTGDLVPFIPADESETGTAEWNSNSLIDAITHTVAPNTWDNVGGPASIEGFPHGLTLVVSQTQEVHEQIDALLAQMRTVKDTPQDKSAVKGSDDLIMRVYALWQPYPRPAEATKPQQQAEKTLPAWSNPEIRASTLAQLGFGGGLIGGSSNPSQEKVLPGEAEPLGFVPPAGTPPDETAALIRELVEPESWTKPDVMLRVLHSRLIIRQSPEVHRKIGRLLVQLGPWHRVTSLSPTSAANPPGAQATGGAFQVADPFEALPATSDPFGLSENQPTKTKAEPRDQAEKGPGASREREQRTGRDQRAAPQRPISARSFPRPSPAEEKIRAVLNQETELEFTETPLSAAIDYLKDKHKIEIQLDERLLADSTVATDTPITMNVKGIALHSALKLMLSRLPSNPTFIIADEVLLITTREGANQRKVVRIYNIDELVDQQHEPVNLREAPGYGRRGGYGAEASYDNLSGLANVIQQTIEPGTWSAENGCAVVPLVSKGTSLLVIRHSWAAHDEIASLLSSLRGLVGRTPQGDSRNAPPTADDPETGVGYGPDVGDSSLDRGGTMRLPPGVGGPPRGPGYGQPSGGRR